MFYLPADTDWLPPAADLPVPSWFIAAFPYGGLGALSRNAGPDDARCMSEADGLRCEGIEGHYDNYRHRASWADGAFTLVWGGAI